MPITITNVPTGQSRTVRQIRTYMGSSGVGTLTHVVIGSGVPDFTIKPAQTRTGQFDLLCNNETDAINLWHFLEFSGPFTLADTDSSIANTTFLVTGFITVEVDTQTFIRCLVRVDFTETT